MQINVNQTVVLVKKFMPGFGAEMLIFVTTDEHGENDKVSSRTVKRSSWFVTTDEHR